jgi:hypothetical protein
MDSRITVLGNSDTHGSGMFGIRDTKRLGTVHVDLEADQGAYLIGQMGISQENKQLVDKLGEMSFNQWQHSEVLVLIGSATRTRWERLTNRPVKKSPEQSDDLAIKLWMSGQPC